MRRILRPLRKFLYLNQPSSLSPPPQACGGGRGAGLLLFWDLYLINTNNNIFKILAPIVGTVFTGTFGYYVGKLQATSTKEIAEIQARSAREVA